MPADIDTFAMLRPSVLNASDDETLRNEMERINKMRDVVETYRNLIAEILMARGYTFYEP